MKWLWVSLMLLVAAMGAAAVIFSRDAKQPKADPIVSIPEQPKGVGSRGQIEPEDGIIVVAAPYFDGRPSIINTLRVKEGDWVRTGQIIGEVEGRAPLEK